MTPIRRSLVASRGGARGGRRYTCNMEWIWRGTGLGAHGNKCFMRLMSQVATSRRGRRPSRYTCRGFVGGPAASPAAGTNVSMWSMWRVAASRRGAASTSLRRDGAPAPGIEAGAPPGAIVAGSILRRFCRLCSSRARRPCARKPYGKNNEVLPRASRPVVKNRYRLHWHIPLIDRQDSWPRALPLRISPQDHPANEACTHPITAEHLRQPKRLLRYRVIKTGGKRLRLPFYRWLLEASRRSHNKKSETPNRRGPLKRSGISVRPTLLSTHRSTHFTGHLVGNFNFY